MSRALTKNCLRVRVSITGSVSLRNGQRVSDMERVFSFKPLSDKTISDWQSVVQSCGYAPANALDVATLSRRDQKARADVVIYAGKGGDPVAVIPGDIVLQRQWRVPFRSVRSYFGGLIIRDDCISRSEGIQAYAFTEIVRGYYRNILKIDFMDVGLPLRICIEDPGRAFSLVPFFDAHIALNSILYTDLRKDILGMLPYNVKRETTIGLGHLSKMRIGQTPDPEVFDAVKALDAEKASVLKVASFTEEYLRRITAGPWYHGFAAYEGSSPVAAVILTNANGVATYNYNASTAAAKKLFLNKALLYQAMLFARDHGASSFVLGHGYEHAHSQEQRKQLGRVTFFKRSFSTNETGFYLFSYGLNLKGKTAVSARYRAYRTDP